MWATRQKLPEQCPSSFAYNSAVDDDMEMGTRDGAANGMKARLEGVGVPPAVASAIGQAVYLGSAHKPQWVPEPIVGESEVASLVSRLEADLRQLIDWQTRSALVLILCTKIFGEIAGKTVFAAGYPHGSPPAIPTRESRAAEEEQASSLMEAGQ